MTNDLFREIPADKVSAFDAAMLAARFDCRLAAAHLRMTWEHWLWEALAGQGAPSHLPSRREWSRAVEILDVPSRVKVRARDTGAALSKLCHLTSESLPVRAGRQSGDGPPHLNLAGLAHLTAITCLGRSSGPQVVTEPILVEFRDLVARSCYHLHRGDQVGAALYARLCVESHLLAGLPPSAERRDWSTVEHLFELVRSHRGLDDGLHARLKSTVDICNLFVHVRAPVGQPHTAPTLDELLYAVGTVAWLAPQTDYTPIYSTETMLVEASSGGAETLRAALREAPARSDWSVEPSFYAAAVAQLLEPRDGQAPSPPLAGDRREAAFLRRIIENLALNPRSRPSAPRYQN